MSEPTRRRGVKRRMAQIKEIALTDLRPDPQNVNLGTEPGSAAHEASIRHNGLGRSILATADNVILAGNKTYEQAGQLGAAKRVVAVDVEGDTLVVVRRTDLKSGTPEATAMALADNRTSEINYAPDEALLAELLQELPTVQAAGYQSWELEGLLELTRFPTHEELTDRYGTPEERDFWPVINLRVSPETHRLFTEKLEAFGGEDDAERLHNLLLTL